MKERPAPLVVDLQFAAGAGIALGNKGADFAASTKPRSPRAHRSADARACPGCETGASSTSWWMMPAAARALGESGSKLDQNE
jgi:hypothetical protein